MDSWHDENMKLKPPLGLLLKNETKCILFISKFMTINVPKIMCFEY